MTCDREIMLLISIYADGEATPGEAERAVEHLASCSSCRKMVEQWQGHQQLFTWAYTREISEPCTADELIRLAGKEKPSMEREKPAPEGRKPIPLRRWAWAGALAAALLIAVVASYVIATQSWLKIGQDVITTMKPQAARMAWTIDLTVGPHSKIRRIDKRTIRVEQGWVAADVRAGSGINITTPRLQVTDRGTRFHVGVGAKADYVTVEEGAVDVSNGKTGRTVTAGQALFADNGTYSVLDAPVKTPNELNGAPLRANPAVSFPTTLETLQWEAGIGRLAARFPDALDVNGGYGRSASRDSYVDHIIGFQSAANAQYRQALRTHLPEIAHILAGGGGDTGVWEIPIGVLQLAGITSPSGLTDDIYYLRLTSAKGNVLVWRLTGSLGSEVDIPVTFKAWSLEIPEGEAISRVYQTTIFHPDNKNESITTFLLGDWPDAQKPCLELRVNGPQELALWQDERDLVTSVAQRCAGVPNLVLRYPNDQMFYLDPQRKHRVLIAWNDKAGELLARMTERVKTGRGGSVIIAAISTEQPLADPAAPAGIYLLRLVLPAAGKSPYLELGTPGNQRMAAWGAPEHVLMGKPGDSECYSFGNLLKMPAGYGRVQVNCVLTRDSDGTFPFTFDVVGQPGDAMTRLFKKGNDTTQRMPEISWTKGTMNIKKP